MILGRNFIGKKLMKKITTFNVDVTCPCDLYSYNNEIHILDKNTYNFYFWRGNKNEFSKVGSYPLEKYFIEQSKVKCNLKEIKNNWWKAHFLYPYDKICLKVNGELFNVGKYTEDKKIGLAYNKKYLFCGITYTIGTKITDLYGFKKSIHSKF